MATQEQMAFLGEILSNPLRIKILQTLLNGELCVNDVCAAVGCKQAAGSHQITTMRYRGILGNRKDGTKSLYYIIDREKFSELLACLNLLAEGVKPN